MKESRSRSTAKAATWRILASLTTMSLAWIFTKDLRIVLSIGGFEIIAKMIIYYFHERAWDKVMWGRD